LLAIVAVTPGWVHVVDRYSVQLPAEMRFLAQLVLPATALLFLAGWVQPGGVGR
jgi:hypothetical protein